MTGLSRAKELISSDLCRAKLTVFLFFPFFFFHFLLRKRVFHLIFSSVSLGTMDEEITQNEADTQRTAKEAAKSTGKSDGNDAVGQSSVTEEQWRSMMDAVLAIYAYRETE